MLNPESFSQCNSNQFQCNNDRCISAEAACNFVDDCGDGSDEQRHVIGFKCPMGRRRNVCVLPQRLINDSVSHCSNDADLCQVNGINRCHKCLTTGMILAPSQVNCIF